jgi:hypothetical protein
MNADLPRLACLAFALACALPAQAFDPGRWNGALRYRYEGVDDEAFARDAQAHTARLRLGWTQPLGQGFSAMLEGEAVAELSDRFNSGANGETGYPAVADARTTEVNQAWLQWRGARGAAILGRQRIVLDNQRFVGNVGWRQNEQTFDALSLEARPVESLALRYHWLDRVHRVFGDEAIDPRARERRLDGQLFNAAWSIPLGTLVGYAYLVEDRDVAAASTRTIGLRWTGSKPLHDDLAFGWTVEAARQRDHADAPVSFEHDYTLLEPSLRWAGIDWKAGFEQLEGDGTHAFQTPFATLHAFNGWADKFLVTPAAGLEDRYASAGGKFGRGNWKDRLNWTLAFHDFDAARGDAAYGREWNAMLGAGLGHGWNAMLKLADYRSDGFARDTRKVWLQFEWVR